MPQITNQTIYVGIDPGASGGIVWGTATKIIGCEKMPATEPDVCKLLQSIGQLGNCNCVLEKVGSRPGNAARAMFTFGAGVGVLRAGLFFSGIPFREVAPGKWMRDLGIPKKKKTETKTDYKNRLKAKAQQLFPSENVTLATADALLIYEYVRKGI